MMKNFIKNKMFSGSYTKNVRLFDFVLFQEGESVYRKHLSYKNLILITNIMSYMIDLSFEKYIASLII